MILLLQYINQASNPNSKNNSNSNMCMLCEKSPSATALSMIDPSKREMLPSNVAVQHYDLSLVPDLDACVFSGVVNATFSVKKQHMLSL